jgi:nucleotide-binding universal stress UspA family protein
MFNTIVVGVDGREGGRDALHLASALARGGDGLIVAVGVYPHAHPLRGGPAIPEVVMEEQMQAVLDRELENEGITAQTAVLGDTSPARGLHRVAEDRRADLLVVGSTHHGRLARVLAGDDAVAALHGSPCPVAVAPRAVATPEDGVLRRIGVGYDGHPESRHALALATALASDTGAHLELRSVVTAPRNGAPAATFDADEIARCRDDAETLLHEALEELEVEASGDVVLGVAADELTDLSHRVDLMIVGSRGWGPVRRILVGSTAAALVRGAACPIVVVPRGAATGQPGEQEPAGAETVSPIPA